MAVSFKFVWRTILNSIAFAALIIFIVISSKRLYDHSHTKCSGTSYDIASLILFIFMLLMALTAMLYLILPMKSLPWIYLAGLLFLIFAMSSSMLFWRLATTSSREDSVGMDQPVPQLGWYNHWIIEYMVNDNSWRGIRDCMIDKGICKHLSYSNQSDSIQFNCCNPPIHCGFVYENGTAWVKQEAEPSSEDQDCWSWDNNEDKLCYECNSCKAWYIWDSEKAWTASYAEFIYACLLLTFIIINFDVEGKGNEKANATVHPLPQGW